MFDPFTLEEKQRRNTGMALSTSPPKDNKFGFFMSPKSQRKVPIPVEPEILKEGNEHNKNVVVGNVLLVQADQSFKVPDSSTLGVEDGTPNNTDRVSSPTLNKKGKRDSRLRSLLLDDKN